MITQNSKNGKVAYDVQATSEKVSSITSRYDEIAFQTYTGISPIKDKSDESGKKWIEVKDYTSRTHNKGEVRDYTNGIRGRAKNWESNSYRFPTKRGLNTLIDVLNRGVPVHFCITNKSCVHQDVEYADTFFADYDCWDKENNRPLEGAATLEELLALPTIKQYCVFYQKSSSYRDEAPNCHFQFVYDQPHNFFDHSLLLKYVVGKLNSELRAIGKSELFDTSLKDNSTHVCYAGKTDCVFIERIPGLDNAYGDLIPVSWVQEARDLGYKPFGEEKKENNSVTEIRQAQPESSALGYIYNQLIERFNGDSRQFYNLIDHNWQPTTRNLPDDAIEQFDGLNPFSGTNSSGTSFSITAFSGGLPPVWLDRAHSTEKDGRTLVDYYYQYGRTQGKYQHLSREKAFKTVVRDICKDFEISDFYSLKKKSVDDNDADNRNIWEIYADMLTNEFGFEGIRLNQMSLQIEVDGEAVDYESVRSKLARKYKLPFKKKDVFIEMLRDLALEKQYHPVKNYLESLPESTNPNIINNLSTRYLGTSSPLYDEYLKKTLIGAVARIFEPGCQLDTVCVLQGLQGVGKSTFWKTLAKAKTEKWFDNSICNGQNDKDDLLKLRKSWIVEMPELDGIFKKKEIQKMRNFITTTTDNFRAPYGRVVESFDRMCILVGTVNNKEFLNDPDGNRRIWVIPVNGKIDVISLEKEVDDLWSAALYWYKKGYQYYLSDEQEEQRKLINAEFEEVDAIEDKILIFARPMMSFSLVDLMIKCEYRNEDRSLQMRIANILRKHGFYKKRTPDKKATLWHNPIYDSDNPLSVKSVA